MEIYAIELALGAIGGVLSVTLAGIVLAAAPRRRVNRLLALLLVLTGIGTFTWTWATAPVALQPAILLINAVSTSFIVATYVYLLVETLETPLVRPLRRRWLRWLVVAPLFLLLVPFASPARDAIAAGPPYQFDPAYEALSPLLAATLLVMVWALAASISAWRRAPRGSPARTRAAHFTLAFGVRDAFVVLGLISIFVELPGGSLYWQLSPLLSVPILAYAILRSQLFDIDLRLKEGVRRGTILGGLLVAFGAIAIVVERTTTQALGLAAGGIGVALLLLAFVPLERFAARVAERFFPGVSADDAYILRRKLEVYRAALEDAIARDATAAPTDRVLADLRRALGVTAEQHAILLFALAPRPSLASSPPEPFEVVSELGRGGSGRALLARDKHLDRYVVLKQPLGVLGAGTLGREMFLREARLAAQIQHPNVVAVHQVLPDRDPPILVLEHVDGESLADRLAREGALAPAEVARIGLDVLAGLERIHRAGIVHRDLKPANILLARDGTAKITDFGVAHAPADASSASALTTMGFQPGSPAYMSPEQARGRPVDARSDLYSLGVVLHEALTGRLPATGRATVASHRVPVSLEPPPAFADTIERALEAEPAHRFTDAAEMMASLRRAHVALRS